MGFMRLKVKEKETLNNEEMALALKESMERMLVGFFGDMLSLTGSSLEEIDPEFLAMYNKYIRQYKEMFDIYLKWAKGQDEINSKNKIVQQTMTGMIEKNHKLLEEINRKLDKKGGDAREA